MRIGSTVQIGRRNEDYEYSAVPGSLSGIVIGIDSHECDNHERVESVDAAKAAYEALQAWCDEENKTRRNPHSVASEGHYVVWLEAWPAEYSPARKPYYC